VKQLKETARLESEMCEGKARGIDRVEELYRVSGGIITMDSICTHEDGLVSRKGVKEGMIKMINLIICGRKDGVFEEELVLLIRLINVWINVMDQTLNVVLRERHIIRQLNCFVWSEVITGTDFKEPLCECITF
jgi:hypothetical protein